MKDLPLLAQACRDHILLLTADRDFGDYIFRDKELAPMEGVVLYRLPTAMDPARKAAVVGDVFKRHRDASFVHRFTVIDEHKIRFRALP